MQYSYTSLDIRKASVFIIIPNLAEIQFGYEDSINFITNIIFYGTFFFILYKIKKNFATLAYIGNDYPIQKYNILLKIAIDYFNIVFYSILLFVSISFLWDFTYLVCGEFLVRPPLHYTRLFKMFIAFVLFMVNIGIKKLRGEKLTIWDSWKIIFLFTPIIIQILMAYGIFTSLSNILTLLIAFFSQLYNDFGSNLFKEWIKHCFALNKSLQMLGDEVDHPNPNKNCIEKPKAYNTNAMNNNSDGSSNAVSSNGNNNGDGSGNNSINDQGNEPESSSKRDKGKGKESAASSDSDTPKRRWVWMPSVHWPSNWNAAGNAFDIDPKISWGQYEVNMTKKEAREFQEAQNAKAKEVLETGQAKKKIQDDYIKAQKAQKAQDEQLMSGTNQGRINIRNRILGFIHRSSGFFRSGPNPSLSDTPRTGTGVGGRPSTSADQTSSTQGQRAELNPRPGTAPEERTRVYSDNQNKPKGWHKQRWAEFKKFISKFK